MFFCVRFFFTLLTIFRNRNDLYITIERGEFERGGKSVGKNIEVSVLVLDDRGQLIDVRFHLFEMRIECVHARGVIYLLSSRFS